MLGARELARRLELDPVIATDVGGTSFDIGTIVDGEPGTRTPVFAEVPVALPIIDVHRSAPAGQHRLDRAGDRCAEGRTSERRRLAARRVDAGGTEPTVTDANVVLGGIDPDNFLGGGCASIASSR